MGSTKPPLEGLLRPTVGNLHEHTQPSPRFVTACKPETNRNPLRPILQKWKHTPPNARLNQLKHQMSTTPQTSSGKPTRMQSKTLMGPWPWVQKKLYKLLHLLMLNHVEPYINICIICSYHHKEKKKPPPVCPNRQRNNKPEISWPFHPVFSSFSPFHWLKLGLKASRQVGGLQEGSGREGLCLSREQQGRPIVDSWDILCVLDGRQKSLEITHMLKRVFSHGRSNATFNNKDRINCYPCTVVSGSSRYCPTSAFLTLLCSFTASTVWRFVPFGASCCWLCGQMCMLHATMSSVIILPGCRCMPANRNNRMKQNFQKVCKSLPTVTKMTWAVWHERLLAIWPQSCPMIGPCRTL